MESTQPTSSKGIHEEEEEEEKEGFKFPVEIRERKISIKEVPMTCDPE
jgi:hypothetical protein